MGKVKYGDAIKNFCTYNKPRRIKITVVKVTVIDRVRLYQG